MEDRTLLQMDQTASPYQGILRHKPKRGLLSDMDCNLHLPVDRNCQEEIGSCYQPLHFRSNNGSNSIREDTYQKTF
jgi:hypothetical protein